MRVTLAVYSLEFREATAFFFNVSSTKLLIVNQRISNSQLLPRLGGGARRAEEGERLEGVRGR